MMRFMDALYELETAFKEDDQYADAQSVSVAIDLWDAFNKPSNPAVSVPLLRSALERNKDTVDDGALGYEMSLMLLNEFYPSL